MVGDAGRESREKRKRERGHMVEGGVRVRRLSGDSVLSADVRHAIDAIFFTASARQHFPSEMVRAAFRQRWLGRYLEGDRDWFYLAEAEGRPIGYLAGSLEDVARSPRFRDLGFVALMADLTRRYPAHLHVNVSSQARSQGIGARLVETFVSDLQAASVAGVHLVTGKGVRNNRFYASRGFEPVRTLAWGGAEMLVFGRSI